jgi:tetraacyldisaccharide 4'-kinase
MLVRLRAACYRLGIIQQKHLRGVVISVGNLTVGGTGKTPMVIWLAQRSLADGRRAGILTRGYRGVADSSLAGQAGGAAARAMLPAIFSDEVWLMWRRLGEKVRFGVGSNRLAWGRKLAQDGVDWFILDDGFQHLRLARDADIVMIDATDPFGGGRLLPAGRLREPPSALARADVVVITRSDRSPEVEESVRRLTAAPIFYARVLPDGIFHAAALMIGPEMLDWQERPFFAFCAIANASAFFEDLQHWGLRLVGQFPFPDHHSYARADVQEIERRATAAGAEALICTEKDIFSFRNLHFWTLPIYYCQVRLHVADGDQFWKTVNAAVARKRHGSAP